MKLMLPEVMHHLEKKDILVSLPVGMPNVVPAREKARKAICDRLFPMMHKATKYIFDSGTDYDQQTIMAVRQTAVNMMDAGMFHLPQPLIWVEDPFEHNPTSRNFYLCEESEEGITIYAIQSIGDDLRKIVDMGVKYVLNINPIWIPLTGPATDNFQILNTETCDIPQRLNYGEIAYSVKKLIVTLNTAQVVREAVPTTKKFKPSLPKLYREYDFQIIRIKAVRTEGARHGGPKAPSSFIPYRQLVAGYMWGKNTRPPEEQRWIKPYWRYIEYPEQAEVQADAEHKTPEKVYYVEPRDIKGGVDA